jgi:hypothetical protein
LAGPQSKIGVFPSTKLIQSLKNGIPRLAVCGAALALTAFVRNNDSAAEGDLIMPRGDKSKYTDKQKRKAEHIEEG